MTKKNEYKKGDIITVKFPDVVSSNTYIVEEDLGETVLLFHPLYPSFLLRYSKREVDLVSPNVKDSLERNLDFAKNNIEYLDYNTKIDLESLCMHFVIKRKLTPRQKHSLATMCGIISSIKLNNDIKEAIKIIKENYAILDDFNSMWYRNFKWMLDEAKNITSKKQRSTIFNIAGFILSELETPVTINRGFNE